MDRNVRFFCENAVFELVMPHPANAGIFNQQLHDFAEQHGALVPIPDMPGWQEEGGGLLLVSWPGLYLPRETLASDPGVTLLAITSQAPQRQPFDDRSHRAGAIAPGLGPSPIGNGDDLFEDDADAEGGTPGREPFCGETEAPSCPADGASLGAEDDMPSTDVVGD